ncbi:uncharacterized protein LOC133818310 [Humulus lupulus]|uniref:uncharacterized protein LOC133818310 n=1 Tax=Humulus lupulus TaxID=3486 RepID=UPI002B40FFF9|nr:uncharacterized protein LOC133818310 [Humulus lupulus]
MKTKTHGGRIRPLPTPSRRSPRLSVRRARSRALPILLNQKNGNEKSESTCVIFVSDSEGDDDNNEGMNPESTPQTVKNGGGMTPQMTSSCSEDSMELDSLEEGETCFRCKGRDKRVMVCSEIGCLIAVHDECMGFEPTFDDLGLFYCPYCKHRRAKAVALEMSSRVMAAKKALLNFLEGKVVGEDKEKEKDCDDADDRNEGDTLPSARDGICCNNKNVPIPNDHEVLSQVADEKEMDDAQVGCHGRDTVVIAKEVQPSTNVVNGGDNVGCGEGTAAGIDPLQGSSTKEASNKDGEYGKEEDSGPMDNGKNERIDEGNEEREILDTSEVVEEDEEQIQTESSDGLENTDDISETESLVNRHRRFKQRAGKTVRSETVTLPKRSSPRLRKAVARQKSTTKKNALPFIEKNTISEKSQQPLKLVPMMDFSNAKRRRLHWTAEEEEMLRDGVHKFSITRNIVLPWKKILEYGRHVFDPSRTPVDLKDKWRNLMAKEGASIDKV